MCFMVCLFVVYLGEGKVRVLYVLYMPWDLYLGFYTILLLCVLCGLVCMVCLVGPSVMRGYLICLVFFASTFPFLILESGFDGGW